MRRRALLALALLALPAGGAGAAAPSRCAKAVVDRPDGWTAIVAPEFPRGAAYLTGYALDPAYAETVFVTNGEAVMRSGDGGCTWKTAYVPPADLDPLGETAPRPSISELGLAPGADGRPLVYLALTRRPLAPTGPAVAPAVMVSRDASATWEAADRGLPLLGSVRRLAFAPDALRGYAIVDLGAGQPALYTTSDGGAVWAAAPGALQTPVTDLTVGAAPGHLWAWNATSLYRSTDAGTTLTTVTEVAGSVTGVAVPQDVRGRPAAGAVVFTGPTAWINVGGGWTRRTLPGLVNSGGYDGRDLVASGPTGVYVSPTGGSVRRIGPAGPEVLRDLLLAAGEPRQVFGLTRAALFRGPLSARLGVVVTPPRVPLPTIPPIELRPGQGAPGVSEPTLRPADLTVELGVGQSRTERYTLDLPPTPTPLDVFFLIDTTNSFGPIIDGLRRQLADIVNNLSAMRIDAQFGVGSFQEYPISPYGGVAPSNYPYQLGRKIGPVDEELEDALLSLNPQGGTTDGRTSALSAAYQAATGAGQDIAPTAVHDGFVIPKDLDAGFRNDAMRVLVLITDTEPRKPETGYFGPSITQVGKALAGRNVLQVGLIVGAPPPGIPDPREAMEALAEMTGALAPRGGLDCDADGEPDVEEGFPLVCQLSGAGLTPAIVELLRGVRDEEEVGLVVTGDPRAVTAASQLRYPDVNVKAYSRLDFDLTFSCPPDISGLEMPVVMQATSRGKTLATVGARVRCGTPPVPVAVVPPVAAVIAPLAPPPPVAPITQPNPLPNPNVNPQPQAHPQAQAGMAAQDQEQPQLAMVTDDLRPQQQEGEELAMSALLGGMAMAAAAGAAMHRTRTNVRTRQVQAR